LVLGVLFSCLELLTKHSQYGLVTDGTTLIIIDGNFKPIDDIPAFTQFMLPNTMEKYSFHCFSSKQKYQMIRDCNLSQEVIVETAAGSDIFSGDQLKLVPTFERGCLIEEAASFCTATGNFIVIGESNIHLGNLRLGWTMRG